MEMDLVELDNDGECIIGETSADQLLSPGSPDVNDIFGDPQVLPRVGDQYQVEIPTLITESDLQLMKNSTDTAELMVDVDQDLFMGLPIPIIWVHDQIDIIKHEPLEFLGDTDIVVEKKQSAESENSKQSYVHSNNKDSNPKVEALDDTLDNGKGSRGSENGEHAVLGTQVDVHLPLQQHEKSNLDQKYTGKGYFPVPGSVGNSWSVMEQESFLLGLYIFGKNLVQVTRFIESKEMGDVLSYYYGKFYRSNGYRRWLDCRKIRSRRCILGQRIFTGWRQQELLSRLLPHVSEECQNTLLEFSKSFGEGKILLEDYVSTLKATVGMSTLIEAIGIGKGKQDLTGIVDPIKTNQVIPIRQEIPSGKECNSLTSADIIKFLTGDFRLSKARSNDLFWEAVWPRLLARGWHSEQPKNHSYAGSRHSLVFLIPGVKKFSRRRLVKGNHYFDSVSDVLNKVALDPKLLEVEVETPKGSKEEYGWGTEMKLDQDGPSDSQRHCYLQPRISKCNSDFMKFTVVDTSLAYDEGPLKVRELRTLPVETTNSPTPTSLSRETDVESSEEPVDEPDSTDMLSNDHGETNTSMPVEDMLDRGLCSDLSDCLVNVSEQGNPINGPDTTNALASNNEDRSSDMCNDKHPRKNTVKCQFSRKVKPGQLNYLAPVTKRRRLTVYSRSETICSLNNFPESSELKEEDLHCHSDSPDATENMVSEVGPSQEKVSTSSSAKGSPDDNHEGILDENCFGTALSREKAEPHTLIDLNLPHVLQDFETGEPIITEMIDSPDDPSTKGTSFPSETTLPEASQALRASNGVPGVEHQPVMNVRRQSTRNRPLTTRALEALACGFLNTKRKRRGTEAMSQESSIPRPSRRARGRVVLTENLGGGPTGVVDPKVDDGVDEKCSSNPIVVCNSQVRCERKGPHELIGIPKPAYHPEILSDKDDESG